MGDATCKEDCPKPARQRGWCSMHYARWRKTGTTDCASPRVARTATLCAVEDCSEPRRRREWCGMHHARWLATGSTDVRPAKPRISDAICAAQRCDVAASKGRWCGKHYERVRKSGSPTGRRRPNLRERFFAKVDQNGPIPERRPDLGPCWLWTGAKLENGYGRFTDARRVQRPAHTCSYILAGRLVPRGHEMDHLCFVKDCVRPTHLEPVLHVENLRRADVAYGIRTAQTHCPKNHEYTPENTLRVGANGRGCRTCKNDHNREYMRRYNARKVAKANE